MNTMPEITRAEQIQMANDELTGKKVSAIKKEADGDILVIEFEHGAVLILGNPSHIALGLPELPATKKKSKSE